MAIDSVPPFDPTLLRTGTDLRRLAIDPPRAGWHRIRRGVWIPEDVWSSLHRDHRYQAMVHATVLSCKEPEAVVLAAHSAAVVWGLPSIEPWPDHVTLLDPGGRSGSSKHIRMMHAQPAEPHEVNGLRLTSPARTVVDLARRGTLETAIAAADHALRLELCSRAELADEADLIPAGARGRSTARLVVELADGLSGSAGESLSRLQMFRANFPRPVLQREYRDEAGLIGYVDFDLDQLIGEFDGRIKYNVPPGASPQEASQIVWREKRREDRLRRFKNVARWDWKVARTPGVLARYLMSYGLKPLPKSTWIDLRPRPRVPGDRSAAVEARRSTSAAAVSATAAQ